MSLYIRKAVEHSARTTRELEVYQGRCMLLYWIRGYAITEEKVLEEKGAFQRKRSCIAQIITVRQLGEKVYNSEEQSNDDGMCRPGESSLTEWIGSCYGRS